MRYLVFGDVHANLVALEAVLGAAKERSLIAALALTPGVVVSAEALMEALWGDSPPLTARKTLQTYVSHLRRKLGLGASGPHAITAVHRVGYRLTGADADAA